MKQKGLVPIIVLLILTLMATVGLVVYKPKAWENFISSLLEKSVSTKQITPKNISPTAIPNRSPAKKSVSTTTPTVSIPSPVPTTAPTPVQTIDSTTNTTAPTPYPTSSATWDEEPDKKDRPFVGG